MTSECLSLIYAKLETATRTHCSQLLVAAASDGAAVAAQEHRVEAAGGHLGVPRPGLGLGKIALAEGVIAASDGASVAAKEHRVAGPGGHLEVAHPGFCLGLRRRSRRTPSSLGPALAEIGQAPLNIRPTRLLPAHFGRQRHKWGRIWASLGRNWPT